MKRLSQASLNRKFIDSLGASVTSHGNIDAKPLELTISRPAPTPFRAYIYNATYPPGGRTLGERKIQLIVPGLERGQRGSFDHSDGRHVLLVGYELDIDVFVLWDAGTYQDFPYSMNVQVNPQSVLAAFAGKIEIQYRRRRTPSAINEAVVCAPSNLLLPAIEERIRLSFERIIEGGTNALA